MDIAAAPNAAIAAPRPERTARELDAHSQGAAQPESRREPDAVVVSLSADAAERREAPPPEAEAATRPRFAVDPHTRSVVFQVVDTRSGEVVMQLPEEALLRRRAYSQSREDAALTAPPSERISRIV